MRAMRATPLVLLVVAACGGQSATSIDGPGRDDTTIGKGDESSSGGHGEGATEACGVATKTLTPLPGGGGPPAPLPRVQVLFDVFNSGDQALYVVNDDAEHETLEVARGGATQRITAPSPLVCGAAWKVIHNDRTLIAVAPGERRSTGPWDTSVVVDGGKLCVACASHGRPDLGVELVDQYASVDAPPGVYTATVKVFSALPPGCTPNPGSPTSFHCAAWAGLNAAPGGTRSSQVSVTVEGPGGAGPNEQHVTVRF